MSTRVSALSPWRVRTSVPAAGLALALVVGLGACGAGATSDGAAPPRPRNAILISIDTLRPDHLGCYGYPRPTSPHLDALARSGVRFTDVTAAAPWTLPSHATMLTGLYPSRHGVKSHQTCLPESVVTLAEEFQARGFETLAVVNTHNVGAPQYRLSQGFRHFSYVTETDEDRRTLQLRTPNMGEVVLAEAREFMAQRDAARPFFLFLHFYDVHTDLTPREDFRRALVGPYEGTLDASTKELHRIRTRGDTLAADDLRWLREMYDAEIRTFDEVLGGFLAWLHEQGLLADTLLVVTSDHGEEFGEHGGLLHGLTQYQELLRVPLVLAGPGIPAGTVVDVPVHGVDVTPTMLAVMGIVPGAQRDGIDLSPAWQGGALPERVLFAEADQDSRLAERTVDTKQMARRGKDKLIVDQRTRFEFYDLALDPGEREDRIRLEPDRARELVRELQAFLAAAVVPEQIPPPSEEEQRRLDALGYGGPEREQ